MASLIKVSGRGCGGGGQAQSPLHEKRSPSWQLPGDSWPQLPGCPAAVTRSQDS